MNVRSEPSNDEHAPLPSSDNTAAPEWDAARSTRESGVVGCVAVWF